ncbi:MAG: hypothetical protein JXO22_00010, partial [Phycisphaerae bacterium]|nr:hypothetical protein [Phycisphaerae bacterium]
MSERVEQKQGHEKGGLAAELLEPVRAALAKAPESERYRALAAFFSDLADGQTGGGGAAAEAEQLAALSKKLTRLGEEKALVDDALAEARADLEHANRQIEADRERAKETERISTDQRTRLRAAQQQVDELEQQLIAKNSQLHEADSEVESLRVKLQRSELSAGDTSRLDSLEDTKRELVEQLERLRADHEQLRADKDAEIEQLKAVTLEAEAATSSSSDKLLADLWDRLARAKPALAPGGKVPTEAAAQRLFEAFIELAFFAHDFDQTMRPFLGSFAR